ncbi:MAG TPA: type II toxin-antitoxin system prevent-host-death family antitoxin [Thermoanaerobaculia bacterium]|nr:type II toxin-antitoxin system prevent-host-death family antitoxin [Thermoanaerobaculia bacterium]
MLKPLSEFQANAEQLIQEVRASREALVLTEEGVRAAVVVEAREYDRLVEELDLLREIHVAEQQFAAGQGIPHEQARAQVLAALKR